MKTGRLLLADRHLGVLDGVYGLLHRLFETVLMVADERSLAEVVTTTKPDLVVVDLSLPGGQEADIVSRLLEAQHDLRLIVLSIYDEPEIVTRTMAAGVVGFVLKRAAATDLIPAVRAALAGRTYISPAVRSE